MKILIASLQVSSSGSKGHLHPAIEVGLECKRRGHEVMILPLPNRLGENDQKQLARTGMTYVMPPDLPRGVMRSPQELALLASRPTETWKAYHSFLVEPLKHQFDSVTAILRETKPDVVLYDLLAYAAPLAARRLNIPNVGFCAGLKLAAPDFLQGPYREYRSRLDSDLESFLKEIQMQPRFHHLELLSDFGHLVFSSPSILGDVTNLPEGTVLAGPLPISMDRADDELDARFEKPNGDYAILSFGSVLDPADFKSVTDSIIEVAAAANLPLLISSSKLSHESHRLPAHASAYPYLPLSSVLNQAKIFFHHGGANTFSEALRLGVPQILIPLTTDQPIQAHYLKRSGAGFALSPEDVSLQTLSPLVERLLNPNDDVHSKIQSIAKEFKTLSGAAFAADYLEQAGAVRELR